MLGALLVTGLLVAVAIVALLVVRGRVRMRLRGPFRTGLDVEGDPTSGVQLDQVRTGRDLKATGPVVKGRRLDAGRDASFDTSGHGEADPPKA